MARQQSYDLCSGIVEQIKLLHTAFAFAAQVNGWSNYEVSFDNEKVMVITFHDRDGNIGVIQSGQPLVSWQQVEEMLIDSDVSSA